MSVSTRTPAVGAIGRPKGRSVCVFTNTAIELSSFRKIVPGFRLESNARAVSDFANKTGTFRKRFGASRKYLIGRAPSQRSARVTTRRTLISSREDLLFLSPRVEEDDLRFRVTTRPRARARRDRAQERHLPRDGAFFFFVRRAGAPSASCDAPAPWRRRRIARIHSRHVDETTGLLKYAAEAESAEVRGRVGGGRPRSRPRRATPSTSTTSARRRPARR